MACKKLLSELQCLGHKCKTMLAGTAVFRQTASSSSDEDECKKPRPMPEPRPDLTMLTHTNQVWAEDDYRNARFMNAKRWVNKNYPIEWGHARHVVYSSERIISCGGLPLTHPILFICLDKPGEHSCFYCGQVYAKKLKNEEKAETKPTFFTF